MLGLSMMEESSGWRTMEEISGLIMLLFVVVATRAEELHGGAADIPMGSADPACSLGWAASSLAERAAEVCTAAEVDCAGAGRRRFCRGVRAAGTVKLTGAGWN